MTGVRRDAIVVVIVLLTAYSLYPLAFAALDASHPSAELASSETTDGREVGSPGGTSTLAFRNVTGQSGLTYEYANEYEGTQSMMSNAGVYVSDYDRDGWTDVLAVGGDRPVLFQNHDGQFERTDALPRLNRSFRAALFVDYDNDGFDDLLLLPMNAEPVFLENRDGTFVRRDVGLNVTLAVPTGASAGDFDGDGCVDVFVIQNGNWSADRPEGLRNYSVAENSDNGGSNRLFRGDCGSFEEVTERAGVTGERWSLATSFTDLDGDGRPDIHVANDFGHDAVYYNAGDGTFEKVRLGNRTNRNGMSSEVADLTGDGRPDVFVTNVYFPPLLDEVADSTMDIRAEGNNLLVNEGDGEFDEAAAGYGVAKGGWGWAAVTGDFSNDGRVDLFHTTRDINLEKYRRTMRDAEVQYLQTQFTYYDYPVVWRQTEAGFVRLDPETTGFDQMNGRGVARLDYDNDGRLDLVVADAGGTYGLYRNVGADGNAIEVEVGGDSSVPALGAQVTVASGNDTQTRVIASNADFLSQDSRVVHVGTGNATRTTVTVTWADGTERTFTDVRTGRRITVSPDGEIDSMPFERSRD